MCRIPLGSAARARAELLRWQSCSFGRGLGDTPWGESDEKQDWVATWNFTNPELWNQEMGIAFAKKKGGGGGGGGGGCCTIV